MTQPTATQPGATQPSSSPAIHRPAFHHVNLKTIRLQEMVDWYSKVVGMEVSHQYPGGAWLTNDAANHRVALLSSPHMVDDPDKVKHTGIHHTAFEYENLGQLLDTYARLRGEGILPHGCLDHGMTMSFYYLDPDGNSVELQADNFGDWAKSRQFMLSDPQFAENPIGVPLDPAKLYAAYQAGASGDDLHKRAYAGEFDATDTFDLRLPSGDVPAGDAS